MLNAKIVLKTGNRVRDSVFFEAVSSQPITPEQAMEAQTRLGYIPAGYDFEDFKVSLDPVLHRYKATWKCQASCD